MQANQAGGVEFVRECKGSDGLVAAYRETIGAQILSGPTTFVPLINEVCLAVVLAPALLRHVAGLCGCADVCGWQAVRRVQRTKKFHLLLIITDGAISVRCCCWCLVVLPL